MGIATRKSANFQAALRAPLVPGRARQFVLERDRFTLQAEVDPITYPEAVKLRAAGSVVLWESNLGALASVIARDPALLGLFRAWRATWTERNGPEGC